mmetsp:Transcript_37070/g.116639  ORF Transcript_37070/g.116639 Transcript_37070/m.116639 type:complete len:399 (-) Transcript_37070:232-1428(-)|eukprot:CAMPEP_0182889504 /NCGR_PEP_ID=MMETSP0034_2-20130328/22074_1 /TAXON_ID=156128 /ORGANISM="Nephroselmis pyriformis, Strain CCMP717" /LENGTH=398 /DNA_ID=CAMNT_0025023005 /DNA_START=374 /DNA_END=1570 /DNA_ORIENTATION=+
MLCCFRPRSSDLIDELPAMGGTQSNVASKMQVKTHDETPLLPENSTRDGARSVDSANSVGDSVNSMEYSYNDSDDLDDIVVALSSGSTTAHVALCQAWQRVPFKKARRESFEDSFALKVHTINDARGGRNPSSDIPRWREDSRTFSLKESQSPSRVSENGEFVLSTENSPHWVAEGYGELRSASVAEAFALGEDVPGRAWKGRATQIIQEAGNLPRCMFSRTYVAAKAEIHAICAVPVYRRMGGARGQSSYDGFGGDRDSAREEFSAGSQGSLGGSTPISPRGLGQQGGASSLPSSPHAPSSAPAPTPFSLGASCGPGGGGGFSTGPLALVGVVEVVLKGTSSQADIIPAVILKIERIARRRGLVVDSEEGSRRGLTAAASHQSLGDLFAPHPTAREP